MRFSSRSSDRAARFVFVGAAWLAAAVVVGGVGMAWWAHASELSIPKGPRNAAWKMVQTALEEGKPKSAIQALSGIEQAAIADKAWAEAARAIATRVFAEAGEDAEDESGHIVGLDAAIKKAPPETVAVLQAIQANWIWGYYQENQWRYQERTQGGADGSDLAKIDQWDLPTIVAGIRAQFATSVGAPGSPERKALQAIPVGEWEAILTKGTMSDAYRPTLWDIVAQDAVLFAASGERGLMAPEDAFEFDAESPALGTLEEFLAWKPETDPTVTDKDSPLLEAASLYRGLLEFHGEDADPSARLSADLDRILWAAGVATGEGVDARHESALRAFVERAGDHELAALGISHRATLLVDQQKLVDARALADKAAKQHPKSHGGVQCANLVSGIDSKELELATERAWGAPFPVIRVTYKNIEKVHLRLCKADYDAMLRNGKLGSDWMHEHEERAILKLPVVREKAIDLPATSDYQSRQEDIPVAETFDAKSLEPGAYWVIASHRPDFAEEDNVVAVDFVWVTRLGIVTEEDRSTYDRGIVAEAARVGGKRQDRRRRAPAPRKLAGYVVDLATGEPVPGAEVTFFKRNDEGDQRRFEDIGRATTDNEGRFDFTAPLIYEVVAVAKATLDGLTQKTSTERTSLGANVMDNESKSIVLVTDRGIHRPGQIVFYKGIACSSRPATAKYAAMANVAINVTLRDANGREVAKTKNTTNANGSFDGNFPIPAGCLPGEWSIQAQGRGARGDVVVRVEEYKRPKFRVELAAPEKSVPLGGNASLTGKALTYTGLPVGDAKVRWRVERSVRFPSWCRWWYPWLSFDDGAQRIARGTATTDASGTFSIEFPAKPDRAIPKDSLPVFTYQVVADVTDPGGETRSDERSVSVGYTDVEANVSADVWQSVKNGEPAKVPLTVSTTTLDGQPRAAAGLLTVHRLVQPPKVDRGDLLDRIPPRSTMGGDRGEAPKPDPANPETWAAGEQVFEADVTTDAAGRNTETVHLPAGLYRATFAIPAKGDVPEVKATQVVEVVDPAAKTYGVKRAFILKSDKQSVEPGGEFTALIGTGYEAGRTLVEISQSGEVLDRFWSEPGRTQWPVSFKATEANRGGFTVQAWMVRDGRLYHETQTVDVPWTDKEFSVQWERFTRKTQPGAKEVWRAKIMRVADPIAGPAAPVEAEFLAMAYDQSLDALAPHSWPGAGFLGMGLFRSEAGGVNLGFTNSAEQFTEIQSDGFSTPYRDVPPMTFREFVTTFGSPAGRQGGGDVRFPKRGGIGGLDEMAQGLEMNDAGPPPPAMALPDFTAEPRMMSAPMQPKALSDEAASSRGAGGGEPVASKGPQADAPPPRKNLVETAFFLPMLSSGNDGIATIEFTLPDTLTTWQVKGLAHDAMLRSGTITDTCISAKDLMVEPMVPRFLREGDVVSIPVKVSNTTTGRLAGTVKFSLADARTDASRDSLIDGPTSQDFDVAAGESEVVVFTVKVADGTDVLKYLATGSATASGRHAADGEEAFLVVLPRRVPVTETIPVTIRGPGERKVSLDRLARTGEQAGADIQNQSLVVQAASNPAWYGVLALPVIMEESDESIETLFTRLYANSLARHLATTDPRIQKIFEQWKGTEALDSPLEKNTDLVKTLLAETPWVREAVDEKEARARIALLFDATRSSNEVRVALDRLAAARLGDGGWPWFPGGRTSCDSVTLGIIAGFGRLQAAGVDIDVQPAIQTIPWLDARLIEERKRALPRWTKNPEDVVLTPIGCYALYARSFFTQDAPPDGEAAEAIKWAIEVGKKNWMKVDARRSQGHLAIALSRAGEKPMAVSIIDSLKQRAVDADVKPGDEKESWQGMWWKDRHPSWWSWADAPIATQAIMIEAFDEVVGDSESVEAMKVWLLSQKRTSKWPGSQSTADAVGALLGRGGDLLGSNELVSVTVGNEKIVPEQVEAGTGFFETRFVRREITPAMASITLQKPDKGIAFGGVHWLYLDDISKVPAAGREELAIEKTLFVKKFTKAGPELVPAGDGTPVEIGDELVVRLVVTSDRDYEFLELADHRPSLTEPVDVQSGWRWGDGAGWYMAIRDASTQLFFERLPRGTHVFEYSLRVAHKGKASSGFAKIQSRYAPEFSAHSKSVSLEVK